CGVSFARAHGEVLDEDMEIVRRVARDTIPSVRREVLAALTAGPMTVRDVCAITKLGDWEARRKLEDLHVLDVLSVQEENQTRFYELKAEFFLFRNESESPLVTPEPPTETEAPSVGSTAPALFGLGPSHASRGQGRYRHPSSSRVLRSRFRLVPGILPHVPRPVPRYGRRDPRDHRERRNGPDERAHPIGPLAGESRREARRE